MDIRRRVAPRGLLVCAALTVAAIPARAQSPTVIRVDTRVGRHAISPLIYGVAYGTPAFLKDARIPLTRMGGNNTTRYNWRLNADNRGQDWYFESIGDTSAVAGERADTFIGGAKSAGAVPMMTIPMIGWVARLGPNRDKLASFSVRKYGPQTATDPYMPDAGNGISRATGKPLTGNDPTDASVLTDADFQQGWVRHLVSKWGTAASGGLRYYILDNEPSLWHGTHRDVHPVGASMNEVRRLMVAHASRIKEVDPGALIVGPEEWGWTGYQFSGLDQQYGAAHGWSNRDEFPDRKAHGGQDYLPWLLDEMRAASKVAGRRLLDVFTTHYYPQGGEFARPNDVSPAMQMRRSRSTRSLWDPRYRDESWINDTVMLIPRMKRWVAQHYPGTRIGLTEYNWGADGHINGATTQADILGIFGREGLDVGARWVAPEPDTPVANAFRMYRSYDGQGGQFGDVSVLASAPDPDNVSAFAAIRKSDGALTVMAINKQLDTPAPISVRLQGVTPRAPAEVWRLGPANRIERLPAAPIRAGSLDTTLPAQTITLFIVR